MYRAETQEQGHPCGKHTGQSHGTVCKTLATTVCPVGHRASHTTFRTLQANRGMTVYHVFPVYSCGVVSIKTTTPFRRKGAPYQINFYRSTLSPKVCRSNHFEVNTMPPHTKRLTSGTGIAYQELILKPQFSVIFKNHSGTFNVLDPHGPVPQIQYRRPYASYPVRQANW